jgi:heme o synthase
VKENVLVREAGLRGSTLSAYIELTKPRITLMVVLTALVGYFMGSKAGGFSLVHLFHTLLGTAMVAGGASVLNQVVEREADARMVRTQRRAIPCGRISPEQGLFFGSILGLGGILDIAVFINAATALLAAATFGLYVFVYTPLKRKTSLNTLVGAVPGALPPVGGWAAASGHVPFHAWALFLIVYLWQIPHFLALAWMLRDDYARGGFRMLTMGDTKGVVTGRHIGISALALVPVSLSPVILGLSGTTYFLGAFLLSGAYAAVSVWAAQGLSSMRARWLFLASVIYLPALLAVMLVDRLPV